MKKKINLNLILLVVGLSIFLPSITIFIINACSDKSISLALLLFAFIIVGSGLILLSLIRILIQKKETLNS